MGSRCLNDQWIGRRDLGCGPRTVDIDRLYRSVDGVRRDGLLRRSQRGSAPIESVFALAFVALLGLGVVEVALALYARNVVASSAHEGARAAAEITTDPSRAGEVAAAMVRRTGGSLVRGLRVTTSTQALGGGIVAVDVVVAGRIDPPGPLPITLPVRATATIQRVEGLP